MKTVTALQATPKRNKNIIGDKRIELRKTTRLENNKYFPNYHELNSQQLTDLQPATAREARDVADLWLGLEQPDEALKVLVKQFNLLLQGAKPEVLNPAQISAVVLQEHLSNRENSLVRTELANLSLKMLEVMATSKRIIADQAPQYLALLDECAQYLSSKHHQISKVKGDISLSAAKLKDAFEYYQVALEYYTQNKAETYKTVNLLWAIGVVHFKQENYAAAEEVTKQALDLQDKIGLPQDHPDRAKLCTLLAMIYNQQTNYPAAITILKTPRETFSRRIVPCDYDKRYFTAKVAMYKTQMQVNIGLNKPKRAGEDFAGLLGLYREKYGEVHHEICALNNFAGALFVNNNYLGAARRIYNQALKMSKALDETNPLTQKVLCETYPGLALTQLKQGEFANALVSSNLGLELQIKIFGEVHRNVANSHNMQSLIHTRANELTAALSANEKALKILIALGTEPRWLMTTYTNKANIDILQNEPKLAITSLTLALAQLEGKLKLTTPNQHLLGIYKSFVKAHQQLNNLSGALGYLAKAKVIAKFLDDNQSTIWIQEKQQELEKLALTSTY